MQENIQVLASLWKLSFDQRDATKPRRLTSSEGHYSPFLSKFQSTASLGSLKKNPSVLGFPIKKSSQKSALTIVSNQKGKFPTGD